MAAPRSPTQPTVSCPHCDGLFEIEEEYRGEAVDCPKCEAVFRIPLTGTVGEELFGDEIEAFDVTTEDAEGPSAEVSCPQCQTLFEVPDAYRGEQAECSECSTLFAIPMSGTAGVRVEEPAPPPAVPQPTLADALAAVVEEAVGPPKAYPAPTPSQPQGPAEPLAASPSDTVAVPQSALPPALQGQVTESGIEKASIGGTRKKTTTVRLSRSDVVANTMAQRRKSGEELVADLHSGRAARRDVPDDELDSTTFSPVSSFAPQASSFGASSPIPPGRVSASGDPSEPMPPGGRMHPMVERRSSSESDESGPKLRKKPRHSYQVRVPHWVGDFELLEGEEILDCVSGKKKPSGLHLGLTAVPVFIIPVAVFLSGVLTTVGSSALFLVVAGAFWAVYAFLLAPRMTRKALIMTSRRALLIDPRETLQADVPEAE